MSVRAYGSMKRKKKKNYICASDSQQGIMKPDIVFFGEDLPRKFYSYMKDMLQTDLVLVMGTSLEVIIAFFYHS